MKITEEDIRQKYIEYLLSIGIDSSYIEKEVSLHAGRKRIRADLVIKAHKWLKEPIVVEFKTPEYDLYEALHQVISYAKLLEYNYFILHNGKKTVFFKKNKKNFVWEEVFDILNVQKNKQKIKIKPFDKNSLLNSFNEINDYLRTNEGLNDFDAFTEVNKIIFCKIFAEKSQKHLKNEGALMSLDWLKNKYESFTKKIGIHGVYEDLKEYYRKEKIFSSKDKIKISDHASQFVIKKLNSYNFSTTRIDVKGMVYEHFISQELRGKLGQYFTPRIIIDFIFNYLKIEPTDTVCDPACGTGGFLINYFKKQIKAFPKLKHKIIKNIHGFDFNNTMVKTSKMNMILHGDGHTNIEHVNSLTLNQKNKFDFITTNPPFGAKTVKKDIADKFIKLLSFGVRTTKTEILFIEKIYDLLNVNGKAAIILPLSIFNNKNDVKIRKFILAHFDIKLVVNIPRNVFVDADTAIQTCIIFMNKKSIVIKPKSKSEDYEQEINIIYINDFKIDNYKDSLENINNNLKKICNSKFKGQKVKIKNNNNYRLDPGYYMAQSLMCNDKNAIKISDIVKVIENAKVSKQYVTKNNLKSIKEIDSNNVVNLKIKFNKSGSYYRLKSGEFFYSRLAAHKGSFVYWDKEEIILTNEYPIFKIKNNFNPYIFEIFLQSNLIKKISYGLATGQGRIRLQVDDFLNIRINKKIFENNKIKKEKYLLLISEKKNIEKKLSKLKKNLLNNKN